ncbi:MAG: hypothetical protein JWL81_831 [Verrucomicrobiales bacterium]|nr:hypothetical protein [Verrucomicrobiales bacterium]
MSVVSTWDYIKAGFWQRIPVPLAGRVPVNAVAVAGLAIAGLDHPVFWAAGAAWEVLWMAGTSGRAGYRRGVDRAARRVAWRAVEERRLQLYNQLPAHAKSRHHALRESCRLLLDPGRGREPEAAAELFCWLHLKLLLARARVAGASSVAGLEGARAINAGAGSGVGVGGLDADVPRLHAGAAVELTDPAAARLAEEAVSILDPRHGVIRDHTLEPIARIDNALGKIESELAAAVAAAVRRADGPGAMPGRAATMESPVLDSQGFPSLGGPDASTGLALRARDAAGMEARLRSDLGFPDAANAPEVEGLLADLESGGR